MALHYRKRGLVWYCRGTVRVGRQVIPVHEFSTGVLIKADAQGVGSAEEARIRASILDPASAPSSRTITIGECICVYRARPGGHHRFDLRRLDELDRLAGNRPVEQAREAWSAWIAARGQKLAPGTIARWRSMLRAALAYGAEEFGITVPALRPIRTVEQERIAYLTADQEARLLAAYSPWAGRVALMLCETGMRTQEALRLDWRCVDFKRGVIVVEHAGRADGPRTKSRSSRRIGMRPVIREMLTEIWIERGHPDDGTVFLSRRNKPYADTKDVGGNPIAKAHRTACKSAEVTRFRVHDWRHHFAIWFLKRGGNIRALCQIAGWSSIRMVKRYAVFEQSDLDSMMEQTAGNK